MKRTGLLLVFSVIATVGFAQKKTTTSATIIFDATTSIDALPKAENKATIAAIDTKKGTVQFEAAVKNFSFTNPKIQEHFNGANWMNSDEFPKATFSGTIVNLPEINFAKDGSYTANINGDLTIRGKAQKVSTLATIVVEGKNISASADFSIKLADYEIDGPPVAAGKLSKEPKISVKADFK